MKKRNIILIIAACSLADLAALHFNVSALNIGILIAFQAMFVISLTEGRAKG